MPKTEPIFSPADVIAFTELREATFAAIKRALAHDSYCKSYEGVFQIQLPNCFEAEDGHWVRLRLGCYKLGPSRHYEWEGATLGACVKMATKDLAEWIAEFEREIAEESEAMP